MPGKSANRTSPVPALHLSGNPVNQELTGKYSEALFFAGNSIESDRLLCEARTAGSSLPVPSGLPFQEVWQWHAE